MISFMMHRPLYATWRVQGARLGARMCVLGRSVRQTVWCARRGRGATWTMRGVQCGMRRRVGLGAALNARCSRRTMVLVVMQTPAAPLKNSCLSLVKRQTWSSCGRNGRVCVRRMCEVPSGW